MHSCHIKESTGTEQHGSARARECVQVALESKDNSKMMLIKKSFLSHVNILTVINARLLLNLIVMLATHLAMKSE